MPLKVRIPGGCFHCVMENLIGDDIARVQAIAGEADTVIHLYGKAQARPGRKMGHVTRLKRR